jgi:hypothetical protein
VFAGSSLGSYVLAGILGALLAVVYLAVINSAYSRMVQGQEQTAPAQPLTVSPQTINLHQFADSTLNTDLFIHNSKDVAYYSVEIEVLIDSPTVKPANVSASPTAVFQPGNPSTNLLDIYVKDRIDKDRNAYIFMIPRIGPLETKRMLLSRSAVKGLSDQDKHEARLRVVSYSLEAVNYGSFTVQPPVTATPVVDVIINADKQLHFENNGPTPIEDVRVFATEYVLDMRAFSHKEIAIGRYQRFGGTVFQIPAVPPHSRSATFNLAAVIFLSFPEFTGTEKGLELFERMTRHYCLRITFKDPSGQKYVGYRVTSALRGKGAPILYENQDDVTVLASLGQSTHLFLHDIPAVLIRYEKTLPGGEDAKEYVFPSSVVKW